MGKILKMTVGVIVMLGVMGSMALLVRPGWGIVGAVALIGLAVLVTVWWLVAVRSHSAADDEATRQQRHAVRLAADRLDADLLNTAQIGNHREGFG